ncbi:fumarylacetoacetate hydrolase family protein [Echinimonas agarilytica]|uniref:Fumarylacetoacetate hydrolase family protein n=1 Tax=Echinimonas agarilytica TaxID=1215918 RepID=A0AA41W5E6_9GAMM|nr:fumarylacetoacetate hydrolase family protein [Echinimonas agarilytica]MCM2678748.1 fumarylacetoacetate hydrolase family protein [Echinimonas agarilytica]
MKSIQITQASINTVTPSKIVCIGRNYVEHIAELNNEIPEQAVVFVKPNSAISNELQAVHQEPLHYEGEICFVVKQGRFAAVGFGLDLTKRTLQSSLKEKGLPWERAKAFNGAAVLGNFVPINAVSDDLRLELWIDGSLAQSGGVSQMMYQPSTVLSDLATFMTLEDGDVVMTGTPKGVGVVNAGSTFEGKIFDDQHLLCSSQWIAK